METDGPFGHIEGGGNLLVALAFRKQGHNLFFPLGQIDQLVGLLAGGAGNPCGGAATKPTFFAFGHPAHGINDRIERFFFGQIAGGTDL